MTTRKNAKEVNIQAQFEALQKAIQTRIENAENDNQAKNLRTELAKFALPVVEYAAKNNVDITKLAKAISTHDKKNADFVAVYALQKIRKTLTALAQGIAASADGYTHTILFNLMHGKQNNKTALVSLSRSIEFTEFDTQEIIKRKYNCAASTAGTQASSTRMMMLHLNLATVTKGKVNDVFTLTDNALAARAREVFNKEFEKKEK